jgi:hypothetical protein
MIVTRSVRYLVLGLATLLACTPIHATYAGAPVRTVTKEITFTGFPLPWCSYPVEANFIAAVSDVVHQNNGNLVVDTQHVRANGTVVNPANGKSVDFHQSDQDKFIYYQDGTLTDIETGAFLQITIPGYGSVQANVGKYVVVYDQNFNLIRVTFMAGQQGDYNAICAYLQ